MADNNPNIVSKAKTVVQMFPGHELLEKYSELFRLGLDKAYQRRANMPVQGAQFFTNITDKKGYRKFHGKNGIGLLRQRKDDEPIPQLEGSDGFGYEYSSLLYSGGTAVTREMLEKDMYSMFGKDMRDLAESTQRTLELIYADWFNRGFGGLAYSVDPIGSGLAQNICEDGCYFISKARPNAYGPAGDWSNRLDDVDWSSDGGGNLDALFAELIRDFKLAFRTYKNDQGIKSPMTLKRLIVSPILEDMAKRVTDTKIVYSGSGTNTGDESKFSENAVNTIAGTKVDVYDWLTDGHIYAEANGENELECLWAVKPSSLVYSDGNPDMMRYRTRMELGLGCPRPSTWMGCMTTNTSAV